MSGDVYSEDAVDGGDPHGPGGRIDGGIVEAGCDALGTSLQLQGGRIEPHDSHELLSVVLDRPQRLGSNQPETPRVQVERLGRLVRQDVQPGPEP